MNISVLPGPLNSHLCNTQDYVDFSKVELK